MHLMLENVGDEAKRRQLFHELTGPLRTMGPPIPEEDLNAPAWWHGDEEAYESSMAAAMTYAPGGRSA